MVSVRVGQDEVFGAWIVELVDFEPASENWQVPSQQIDKDALAGGKHRAQDLGLGIGAGASAVVGWRQHRVSVHGGHPYCGMTRSHHVAGQPPYQGMGKPGRCFALARSSSGTPPPWENVLEADEAQSRANVVSSWRECSALRSRAILRCWMTVSSLIPRMMLVS
jgi:hypothetical protein